MFLPYSNVQAPVYYHPGPRSDVSHAVHTYPTRTPSFTPKTDAVPPSMSVHGLTFLGQNLRVTFDPCPFLHPYPTHSGGKFHIVMVYNPFLILLDWTVIVLLRILHPYSQEILLCSFLIMSVFGFGIRVMVPHRMRWEVFSSLEKNL